MAFQGFGKSSGPTPVPTRSPTPFGHLLQPPLPTPAQSEFSPQPRPSLASHGLDYESNGGLSNPRFQSHQRSLPSSPNTDAEAPTIKLAGIEPSSSAACKRGRSPPPQTSQVLPGDHPTQDDGERETHAKAKRLARFKDELDQTIPKTLQSSTNSVSRKLFGNRHDRSTVQRPKTIGRDSVVMAADLPNDNPISNNESLESSNAIVGLCPDMCPESERGERERKGDLDQYERFDGDRNQTNKFLAIKKYTRTAEREAHLIRPMPILLKTFYYLLSLLDRPYDDKFLGIYNFLWDRMRAIRMDLRMQHIFNLEAITMLEQMIRLHIIAMHELCEFTKGEGFSEGFDAHLNIEQMNKTSVELFQMYDDHKKNGVNVPTEREFRGYYALLKLDKHPGYKVEPAELSLDLGKMTTEIRRSSEVGFARDVARVCRAGNFIGFFRLARKASYLQACLMHAHFAKLRSQALASLHSGLQNNQGLPVAHLSCWLGMEQEDVLSLLEYHGFLVKEFEEPYMVKDGPFINGEQDFLATCSELVHLKRSGRIVEDVRPESSPDEDAKAELCTTTSFLRTNEYDFRDNEIVMSESYVPKIHEEVSGFETISSPRDGKRLQPMLTASTMCQQNEADQKMTDVSFLQGEFSMAKNSPEFLPDEVPRVDQLNRKNYFESERGISVPSCIEDAPLQIFPSSNLPDTSSSSQLDSAVENSSCPREVTSVRNTEDEEPAHSCRGVEGDEDMTSYYDAEAALAKLKLIFRTWKKHASRRIELRNRRQLRAETALNMLSIGPTIIKEKDEAESFGKFDMNHVMWERYQQLQRSWSRLNVSEVAVDELKRRNPDMRCLCWKILLCSQVDLDVGWQRGHTHLDADRWLHSKLMPTANNEDDDGDLVISFPGLYIWRKWVLDQSVSEMTCCLSIIRDTKLGVSGDTILGTDAVVFLLSESLSLVAQRTMLHDLLQSLPAGSCVPLLVLSVSCKGTVSEHSNTIADGLGLLGINRPRISSFMVVFLVGNHETEQCFGFFSDERLREGLEWLAGQLPPQPFLHRVKTRDLVVSHLNSSLKMLYEVCPDKCISAFNEALSHSAREIAAAASASSPGWPCPEVLLLSESSDEMGAVRSYLADVGWNSDTRIEALACALEDCKLPLFRDDISWLGGSGCGSGREIERHVQWLEDRLVKYLSKMMMLSQAMQEAHIMLQKGTQLELCMSRHFVVPDWVTIFRRIFNWRLMSLSSGGALAVCYVLEVPVIEGMEGSPRLMVRPSLDDMVRIGCDSPLNEAHGALIRDFQVDPKETSEAHEASICDGCQVDLEETGEERPLKNGGETKAGDGDLANKAWKDSERLREVLEQCKLVQKRIDERLSLYF